MAERARGLSLRWKLTLSYAALVVIVGIAVFVLGLLSLRFVPDGNLVGPGGIPVPRRVDLLEVYVKYASWMLAGLAVVGLAGGWFVAGFMLRPLARITDVARSVRDGAFERRIRLPGRRDELVELADAFDDMLERVQNTVDEQRRFAANASHELRTPHTVIRTMLDVARADPAGRDVDLVLSRVAETNERSIRITEALLRLSRVGSGVELERDRVDLADVARDALDAQRDDAEARRIAVDLVASTAVVRGDPQLLAQLVANLLRNAIVHNRSTDARIHVSVTRDGAASVLTVSNTGPVVAPDAVATFTEPFVRGRGRTRGSADGQGLGLAIVAAIVRAHEGTLALHALPSGGLSVRVRLPAML
jgi:two-component system, OmpR family, sensor histidine kinase VanS